MKLARYAGLTLLGLLLVGAAVPYLDAGGYRERIRNALEAALNRKVTAGRVRFNLLTGPGFTVEEVTIAEDPRIGIEPIAYVPSLNARVRWTTLFTRRLAFSNLRLNEPTVNLSKSDDGLWNFKLLLRDASARPATSYDLPSIEVRGGRINFKFGDYKTIFYLTDSDLDVTPLTENRMDVRFSGQPARTDQGVQNLGRLLGRGIWTRAPLGHAALDANIELERSSISELARLVEGHDIGLHGEVASRAHLSGPIDKLKLSGQLRLEDLHRWDLLPSRRAGWDFKFNGAADLVAQRIELQTDRQQYPGMLLVRVRLSDYLSAPKWGAMLELREAAVSGFLDLARHMGASLPEGLSADGTVTGSIGYARPGGFQGQFQIQNSSLSLHSSPPLDIRTAQFAVDGNQLQFGPGTVALSGGQTAEIKGAYDAGTGALNVEVNTPGMSVAELHSGSGRLFGVDAIPILEKCRQGTWRGWLHYDRDPGGVGAWSGSFELRGTRLDVEGMSEPVRVVSANIEVEGPKVSVTQLTARAGGILFKGEYRHDRPGRADQARFEVGEAQLAAIEDLFLPSLKRDTGFLAQLRLRTPQVPEWLRARHLEANLHIQNLAVGEQTWSLDKLRLLWDGTAVALRGIEARQQDAQAGGQVWIDLSGPLPGYQIEGKLEDLEYRGGTLSLDGAGGTRGLGRELLTHARASGTFAGDDLTLSPDLSFGVMSGSFELTPGGRLRLASVQAAQGIDAYTGQGATQADGKMLLELTSGKRQVRVAVAR